LRKWRTTSSIERTSESDQPRSCNFVTCYVTPLWSHPAIK